MFKITITSDNYIFLSIYRTSETPIIVMYYIHGNLYDANTLQRVNQRIESEMDELSLLIRLPPPVISH
jgi:hypothetical protein